jgi:calcineurin-like phosphoesterase
VTFRKVGGTQGVSGLGSLSSLALFPNPTTGKATVAYTAGKPVKELQITVTNMTGQVMLRQDFTAPGRDFQTILDLSDRPRGFYFVELRADGEKLVRKLVVQ